MACMWGQRIFCEVNSLLPPYMGLRGWTQVIGLCGKYFTGWAVSLWSMKRLSCWILLAKACSEFIDHGVMHVLKSSSFYQCFEGTSIQALGSHLRNIWPFVPVSSIFFKARVSCSLGWLNLGCHAVEDGLWQVYITIACSNFWSPLLLPEKLVEDNYI